MSIDTQVRRHVQIHQWEEIQVPTVQVKVPQSESDCQTWCEPATHHNTASPYPQMLAQVALRAGPGSTHWLQAGRALGDSLPIDSEALGPSVQTGHQLLNWQAVLGFLQNLCVHLKVHHCPGKSLTCSQTRSVKPPAVPARVGSKV